MGKSNIKKRKRMGIMHRFLSAAIILLFASFAIFGQMSAASASVDEVQADTETAGAIVSQASDVDAPPAEASQDSEAAEEVEMETEAARVEPDFTPVAEELLPLKTRIISISARNTPIKDVLYTVGENTGLNIVMETGVNPELPMTVTLKEVAADEALDIIFSSVDYYYELKGNVLVVKALETRMFEFGHPAISQTYSTEVGGDLFGATEDIGNIKGGVEQTIEADSDAFNLWDALSATLSTLAEGGDVDINKMTGTIVVTATRKNLQRIEDYLAKLKEVLSRRVLVEARIVEVTLTDNLKYGIDWTFLDNLDGAGDIFSGTINYADDIVDSSTVSINPGLTDPNFFIATLGQDFAAIISALDEQGDTEVLSNPRLGIMNGQTALLSVGRKTDYISEIDSTVEEDSDSPTQTTITYDVTTSSILSGVMLGIVPNISENGEVTLTITPIVSDLVDINPTTLSAGGVTDAFTISLPIIDLKELSTVVKVKDGEMVIIGGHIDKTESLEDRQVPFLGRIPLIGYLFKQHEKVDESTELVILLKATVDKVGL
jgi:MSHA type pilus biogenesis protein MshL